MEQMEHKIIKTNSTTFIREILKHTRTRQDKLDKLYILILLDQG